MLTEHKGGYFVHSTAICETTTIGAGSRIWAFAHILPKAKIGKSCIISDNVFIENKVVIGDCVTLKCGVQLWDGTHIKDNVFIGPNVTFSNENFPHSKGHSEKKLTTVIEQGASIGANATILPGLNIGTGAMIGAGSMVIQNVPPHAVVVGNPAKIIRYTEEASIPDVTPTYEANALSDGSILNLGVGGCKLYPMANFHDMRGGLMVTEFGVDLPFIPQRSFYVHSVPNNKVRGEHSHKICEQFLIALNGSLSVLVDNGIERKEVLLNSPDKGLYMPAGIWGVQYKFSSDAILCVYASHSYDANDYIREYDAFIKHVNNE